VAGIARHRHLILSLIRRQYNLRYRQSFAGLVWAVVPPLVFLGAASLVFDRIAGLSDDETPYSIATLAALIPWMFFASSLTFGIASVDDNKAMVNKLAFPRAALPLSMVGTSLLDLGISLIIFVAFAYTVGEGLPLTVLWFPVVLLIEVTLVIGLVMLGSALNVFARDIRLALPLAMPLWLFVTPVMYPLSATPDELRTFFLANPMTGIIESFKDVLAVGEAPDPALLVPAAAGACIALMLGVGYFKSTESRFADVV
jgi:lipopolysaccharide transport system permease protein